MEGFETSEKTGEIENLPRVEDDQTPAAKDITDPNAYTIEEAKQKEERDNIIATAEGRKRRSRDYLDSLRKSFRELCTENNARPQGQRISKEALEIDTGTNK